MSGNEESPSAIKIHSGHESLSSALLASRAEENKPIAHVPVEILSEIFCHLRAHPSDDDRWIRILQVCTYWRTVALGTARLWTRISDHRESSATLIRTLSCSRQLPLEVRMNFRGLDTAFFAQALFPHRCRVKTLSAVLSTSEELGLLCAISLPEVQTLMLTSMQTQSTFPFAHFGSAALVHLTDTNIAFNSLNLANLMVLTIDNSRSSLPNLMNLISVLREAPALGSLTVTGRWMSDPAEELDILRNDQVVPLQNLVKVDLRTEAVFVREFFSVVSVPATSQIHLHVRKPAGSDEVDTGLNLEDAFPDENRFHHLGCLKSTKILTLTLESGAQPFLLCFDDVTSGSLCIYPALADITRDPTHWQVLIDDCVDAIEHLAIKKGVVTLSLRDDPLGHLSTLNLAFLFNSIPNLRILVVKARHVDSVLDALKLYSQGREVVVCPELVAIRFEDLTVDGDVVTHIVECFETRRDSGSGVRVLDLSAAGGCEAEHLEILERACQQVLV